MHDLISNVLSSAKGNIVTTGEATQEERESEFVSYRACKTCSGSFCEHTGTISYDLSSS